MKNKEQEIKDMESKLAKKLKDMEPAKTAKAL
jgi:hypothetical protein